jgi:hypothetical protein
MAITRTTAREMNTPLGTYSLNSILISLVALACVISLAVSRISLYLRHRKFAQEHGCKPPRKLQTKDPIFGSDLVRTRLQAARNHTLLEWAQKRFLDNSNTFSTKSLGQKVILTIEPQNIKTILSLKFEDFGLGNREETLGVLLGKGIFTTDGEAWAHSRAMVRKYL